MVLDDTSVSAVALHTDAAARTRRPSLLESLAVYASDAAHWNGDELRLPGKPLPETHEDRCRALSLAGVRSIFFIGDSRSRNLAEVFAGLFLSASGSRKRQHIFDLAGHVCRNHAYRDTHEVECGKVVPPSELHCNGIIRVDFKAYGRAYSFYRYLAPAIP